MVVGFRYAGTLSTKHLRAVGRVGLRAFGVVLNGHDYAAQLSLLRSGGDRAQGSLVANGRGWSEVMHDLGQGDPEFALRVPVVLGLGWRLAETLDHARGLAVDETAAQLAACFNLAITTYDRLVDERAAGPAGARVTVDDVSAVFTDPVGSAQELARRAQDLRDPTERMFILAMSEFARLGSQLLAAGARQRSWCELGRLVRLLYESQDLGQSVEKSALPVAVTMAICVLAQDGPAPQQVVSAFGRLLADVDDAADIVADLHSGAPNSLLSENSQVLGDVDLYDLVLGATERAHACIREINKLDPHAARFATALAMAWFDWPVTHLAPAEFAWEPSVLERGVRALLAASRGGYLEATHWLRLPRGNRTFETHPALVAQRAVVLDALLEARDIGADVPEAQIFTDIAALLRDKHRCVRGGWNYLPTVPELPPDADDLGHVLQVLARCGEADLVEAGQDGIRMLLDAAGDDGGVQTWIVDESGESGMRDAVQAYLPIMGGWGVHTDAVANFALGLHAIGLVAFEPALEGFVSFLTKRQEPDGSWSSRWYDGPYYGTAKAMVLFNAVAPDHPALERGRRFLRSGQGDDGGWGDALSTALAMVGLVAAGHPEDDTALVSGARWLSVRQADDGNWEARPWIAFDTMDGKEIYASRTMTTAFAVKALAAATRRVGRWEIEHGIH